jgi:predicted alpha-1,6-mannanase (GH76 family)
MTMTAVVWAVRAAAAEQAVHTRHLRALWWLPRTRLGVIAWPPSWRQRLFLRPWHYWWQAHLMDCLLDAQLRVPVPARRQAIGHLANGIRLRNSGRWTNDYYDDIAWLGLALQRAASTIGVDRTAAVREITARLHEGWTSHGGGGIWWRVGDDFKNVPANGPAAILLARSDDPADRRRAVEIGHWITAELVDRDTGVVWDGLRVDPDGSIRAKETAVYSYCQGVYLGACVELARIDGDGEWMRRAARAVATIEARMIDSDGVLRCHGAGDGGLFTGILARYLALAAVELPAAERDTRRTAAQLVLTSAEAAWRNRGVADGGPLFGQNWSSAAGTPPTDLSVQLSGWMLCEAAALIERRVPTLELG